MYRSSKGKKQEDFLKFLYQLRHKEKKKWIVLVVDNARIHHAKKVKLYCEIHFIKLIYLPPYSPELNPIEFLWKRIKKLYRMIQWNHEEIMR
jgi:transposase